MNDGWKMLITAIALGIGIALFFWRLHHLREAEKWKGFRGYAETDQQKSEVESTKSIYEILSAVMLILMTFLVIGVICLWIFA
jgi:flagellin-like protein